LSRGVTKALGFVANSTVAFAATAFVMVNSCGVPDTYMWNACSGTNVSQLGQEIAAPSYEETSTASDWLRFQKLSEEWRRETAITPSVKKMSMSRPYQKIIGMGMAAVPFILGELELKGNDPEHWFWALEMITGINPVPEENYGNTVEMARAWLKLAEEKQELVVGMRATSLI